MCDPSVAAELLRLHRTLGALRDVAVEEAAATAALRGEWAACAAVVAAQRPAATIPLRSFVGGAPATPHQLGLLLHDICDALLRMRRPPLPVGDCLDALAALHRIVTEAPLLLLGNPNNRGRVAVALCHVEALAGCAAVLEPLCAAPARRIVALHRLLQHRVDK